jgi:hypothetical protein
MSIDDIERGPRVCAVCRLAFHLSQSDVSEMVFSELGRHDGPSKREFAICFEGAEVVWDRFW